ncbi:phosphopantetheine-binding protein [Streptomyces sp. TRM70308]|uniref:phosphopantetheine-binding protein n=1 Tax=Streptomyces sp. TRM70308 TaxID=3131932 RepID=UPI003D03F985
MSREDRQDRAAAPTAPGTDLLPEVVDTLAEVLRLPSDRIDPERMFPSLGLDSVLAVEFLAAVNTRWGAALEPYALFDHPTPLALSWHLARERSWSAAPAWTAASGSHPGAQAASRAPGEVASGPVLETLREELARILGCDPWDIDPTAPFRLLGVDSIVGSEFVAAINGVFDMRERAVTLYDHPNLASMAAYLTRHAGRTPTAAASPGARPARPRAVRPWTAEPLSLNALLDAVRDDRLSVDAALGLLPRSV